MQKVTDILNSNKFTISVEIVPPRNGVDPDKIYKYVSEIKDHIDFVSVTKGAGGSLRGGSLPLSYFIQEKYGINVIAHFVCRERTKQEIENDMMDLYDFNIKNILALRGDPPAGSKEEWNGDYDYAYQLVEQIKWLNKGHYLPRNKDEGDYRQGLETDFCILVAGHPEAPIEKEIEHMKEKVKKGAEVIITQMLFTFDEYKNYVEALRNNGINVPVIPGIRPLKRMEQIESVEKFFKLKVCDELKEGIRKEGDSFGYKYFTKLISDLKAYGAPGVHLFLLNDLEAVKDMFSQLSRL
jgi:methylenetetrahydrofolate reductase (NADPH)